MSVLLTEKLIGIDTRAGYLAFKFFSSAGPERWAVLRLKWRSVYRGPKLENAEKLTLKESNEDLARMKPMKPMKPVEPTNPMKP
jgi:hypothetical protein